jgi:hypothetical protein
MLPPLIECFLRSNDLYLTCSCDACLLQDEAEYWVPGEAARLGLEFLTSKIPHASPKVIMDFLRSMNKVTYR